MKEMNTKTNIRPEFHEKLKKASETVGKNETGIFEILEQKVKIIHGDLPIDGDVDNVGGSFSNSKGEKFHFFIQ